MTYFKYQVCPCSQASFFVIQKNYVEVCMYRRRRSLFIRRRKCVPLCPVYSVPFSCSPLLLGCVPTEESMLMRVNIAHVALTSSCAPHHYFTKAGRSDSFSQHPSNFTLTSWEPPDLNSSSGTLCVSLRTSPYTGIAILLCNVLCSVHCTVYTVQALSEEEKPGQSLG